MKTLVKVGFAALAFTACTSGDGLMAQSPSAAEKQTVKKLSLSFRDGAFVVEGKAYKFPLSMKVLVSKFGEPDRQRRRAYIISTWDSLGLFAYQKTEDGPVLCLTIAFSELSYAFAPKTPFRGTFRYFDKEINARSTRQELDAAGLNQDDTLTTCHIGYWPGGEVVAEYIESLRELTINPDDDPEDG
ncbi:DUF7738 domain-containing protein [Rhodopirellula halodulae]|uniref:DUF7738 domain-containing protein n=1 Tax=Rhodopirellula halodulae TaxID=2894198 RepID=UPI001E3418EE|nr:hypothetical protein [Rhodopirellula sp. JC737]